MTEGDIQDETEDKCEKSWFWLETGQANIIDITKETSWISHDCMGDSARFPVICGCLEKAKFHIVFL